MPSPAPKTPPRRPTIRHAWPRSTAWIPCRRSQRASSKPFDGPGGARSSPTSFSLAPWGGARPSGSSSRAGSRVRSVPQRSTSTRIRWSNAPARGGSWTSTRACSNVPIRGESALRSSWASRTLPQPQATTRRAAPSTAHRSRTAPTPKPTAARAAATRNAGNRGTRTTSAPAHPTQTAPTTACGRRIVTSRDHQTFQLGHVRGPDSRHALKLGHRVERSVRLSVVEDLLRRDRPDPR